MKDTMDYLEQRQVCESLAHIYAMTNMICFRQEIHHLAMN